MKGASEPPPPDTPGHAAGARTLDWSPYAHLYLSRLASVATGVVLTVASARALQPEGRGEFVALATAASLAAQVLNLGLSSSLVVLFSRRKRRVAQYRSSLVYLPALAALAAAALGLLGGVVAPQAAEVRLWPLLAAWVPAQLVGLHQAAALMALDRAKTLARIELASRLTAVALGCLSLLVFPGSVPSFLAALIAADYVAALLQGHALRSEGRATRPLPASPFRWAALRLGLKAYPLLFLPLMLIKSDILMLRWLRGAAETGVYSVASQAVDILLILPVTIGAVALPTIVRSADPMGTLVGVLRPTLALTLGLAAATAFFGYWPIVLVFGMPYAGAYGALLLLAPGFVCLALQSVLSQYFAAKGFPPDISGYWLLGLAVNLGLNAIFIPRYGYLAAAASSSVAYALVLSLAARHFVRELRARQASESTRARTS